MERKLFQAFDRQRFQQNERLAGIINEVESRYVRALKDDNLEIVSASGVAESVMNENLPTTFSNPEEQQE